jgi:hypothetical protein
MVIPALFLEQWSVTECLAFFHKFARRVFPTRKWSLRSISLLAQIYLFLRSYFVDGRYDPANLEDTLREAFDDHLLFNPPDNWSRIKIAVTATTISKADLCLFTNYNGATILPSDSGEFATLRQNQVLIYSGYKIVRAQHVEDEVLIWEAYVKNGNL